MFIGDEKKLKKLVIIVSFPTAEEVQSKLIAKTKVQQRIFNANWENNKRNEKHLKEMK